MPLDTNEAAAEGAGTPRGPSAASPLGTVAAASPWSRTSPLAQAQPIGSRPLSPVQLSAGSLAGQPADHLRGSPHSRWPSVQEMVGAWSSYGGSHEAEHAGSGGAFAAAASAACRGWAAHRADAAEADFESQDAGWPREQELSGQQAAGPRAFTWSQMGITPGSAAGSRRPSTQASVHSRRTIEGSSHSRRPSLAHQNGEVHANPVFAASPGEWAGEAAGAAAEAACGSFTAGGSFSQLKRAPSRLSRCASFTEQTDCGAAAAAAGDGREGSSHPGSRGHSRRGSLLHPGEARAGPAAPVATRPSEQSLLHYGDLEGLQCIDE
ncbi:hypothetical protein CHLNCDRAFT_140557 [Chlorella variabilis]|uniref:Uncharacterized protein n=1 Tax=Chlorella variabilis TaxID=554065 RepID=E1Z5N8_CHLVA|nr:hypothetical protein CHLNCDRAFT_140557 [Chlorella variabilis]EFN58506.1 hypothetical protein CHLNCDRAFT_140557 [Chlorella variabilis]|eukprot:XP_005850608.1 hypothetical protein CHLNCDRAFT_140557 [Chlorella variabilis]